VTTTRKLVELTPDKAVIESIVVSDITGQRVANPPQTSEIRRAFFLVAGVKPEDVGKPEKAIAHGEDPLQLAGRVFKAQWFDVKGRTESGESLVRIWMSDEAPGKLLRSVTRFSDADKVTTVELAELKTP
jgi:hypothetical protein